MNFENRNFADFAVYLPAVNDAYQRVIDSGVDLTRSVPSEFNTGLGIIQKDPKL